MRNSGVCLWVFLIIYVFWNDARAIIEEYRFRDEGVAVELEKSTDGFHLRVTEFSKQEIEDFARILGSRSSLRDRINQVIKLEIKNFKKIKKIKAAAFLGFSRLERLDLSAGGLEEVDQEAFLGLAWLKIIDLSANKLMTLPDGIFSGLPRLMFLNIVGNQKLKISRRAILGEVLVKECFVDLSGDQLIEDEDVFQQAECVAPSQIPWVRRFFQKINKSTVNQ